MKQEPHKRAKLDSGRLRLIMVMSLEDQVVDRILMSTWSEAEKDFFSIPGKTGWTPLPLGYRLFESVFPGKVLGTDCSSFDWTFPAWVAKALLEIRLSMVSGSDPVYETMVRNRWSAVLEKSIVRLPDGTRYMQQGWGVMKSGWFRTIAENSSAQVLINSLAWLRAGFKDPLPTMWTMGDDVILNWDHDNDVRKFEESLATTGIIVKQSTTDKEFAGFAMENGNVNPVYTSKHKFALQYVSPVLAREVATSYTLVYALASTPEGQQVRSFVEPHSAVSSLVARLWARSGFALDVFK